MALATAALWQGFSRNPTHSLESFCCGKQASCLALFVKLGPPAEDSSQVAVNRAAVLAAVCDSTLEALGWSISEVIAVRLSCEATLALALELCGLLPGVDQFGSESQNKDPWIMTNENGSSWAMLYECCVALLDVFDLRLLVFGWWWLACNSLPSLNPLPSGGQEIKWLTIEGWSWFLPRPELFLKSASWLWCWKGAHKTQKTRPKRTDSIWKGACPLSKGLGMSQSGSYFSMRFHWAKIDQHPFLTCANSSLYPVWRVDLPGKQILLLRRATRLSGHRQHVSFSLASPER